METVLLYTIYVIEETAKYWFVYYGILNFKMATELKRYVGVFLIITATVLVNMQFLDMEYSLILLISRFLCICLLIDCEWRTKIMAFIPVFFLIDLMDTIITILVGCFFDFNSLIIMETENLNRRLMELIPGCILLGIVAFLNYNRRKHVKYSKNVTRLQYFFIFTGLLCVAMLTAFASYIILIGNVWEMQWFRGWFAAIAAGTVIIFILFLGYIKELEKKQNIQNEKLLMYERQNILQKEYYQKLHEKNERLKHFQHDYHHHLYCLNELLQNKKYAEAVAYIRHIMEREENQKIEIVYSGNILVDAVICGVLGNAETKDIHFEYEGKLRKNLGVEDVDFCILLANALENAVEACARYYGRRYIRMKCATYKSGIFITVCNSCVQRQKRERTEKKDKIYHGYGIENMQAVVKRYNGSLQYKEENEEFMLKIYLEEKELT